MGYNTGDILEVEVIGNAEDDPRLIEVVLPDGEECFLANRLNYPIFDNVLMRVDTLNPHIKYAVDIGDKTTGHIVTTTVPEDFENNNENDTVLYGVRKLRYMDEENACPIKEVSQVFGTGRMPSSEYFFFNGRRTIPVYLAWPNKDKHLSYPERFKFCAVIMRNQNRVILNISDAYRKLENRILEVSRTIVIDSEETVRCVKEAIRKSKEACNEPIPRFIELEAKYPFSENP